MVAMATPTDAQPQDDLRVDILGPLEVHRGGVPCLLGGRQQRFVLALLALETGHAVSLDRIADALWGDNLPPSYVTTIQTYVFRLREVLEPDRAKGDPARVLVSTPGGGYRLELPPETVDAMRFEADVARGRAALEAGDASTAAATLGEALALWRGDVLSDLGDLGPAAPAAQQLGEVRLVAIEDWAAAELALGHHSALVPQLASLEAAHPLRERLAALRMVALYRSRRQAEALTVYEEARRRLAEELGVSPGEELRSLHERILKQDHELARSPAGDPPALLSWTSRTHVDSTSAGSGGEAPSAPVSAAAMDLPLVTARPIGRPTSRTRAALALATVVLIGSTLVSTGITRARDQEPVRSVPANSVAAVGPSGLMGDAVVLGAVPAGLAEDAGSVWVLDHTNAAVARVDPESRKVVQTIHDVGNDLQAISARGGAVWVAAFGSRTVTRIDAETNQVVDRIEVGNQPSAILASDTEVWVANSADNTVQRIDVKTGKTDPAIPVGNGPSALALHGSTLWVANARGGTVTELNTHTGTRNSADIVVDAGPAALAVTETDVWVANQLGRTVSRFDRTSREVARIFVDDGPSSIVPSGDDLWVGNAYAGTLSRINSRSNAVTTVPVGSSPRALARVGDGVWAASGAFDTSEHVGGTLIVAENLPFDTKTVDPTGGYYASFISMLRLAYDGLVAFSRPGGLSGQTIVPDLATALPQATDGGRTYIFTIRRGIHYSDGREVKAADFKRGFQRTLVRVPDLGLFDAVVGAKECEHEAATSKAPSCELPGVTTDNAAMQLTIHLSEPDPALVDKLAYIVAPAPEGTSFDAVVPPRWIPSTGPYQIGSLGKDGTLTLVRNPYFTPWSHAAQPAGYPDVIEHRFTESPQRATELVLAGEADLAPVPYQLYNLAVSHPAQTHVFDEARTDFLYVNTHQAPFDNVLVRRALNYAVDRREFVKLYSDDRPVARASCQMLPPNFSSYASYCPYQTGPPDKDYRGPDLEKARRLVAQSGTQGASVVIHRKVQPPDEPQNPWYPFPEYIAQVLRDLGYQATVEDIPEEHRPYSYEDPAYEGYQLFTQAGWVADYDLASTFYDHVASCRHPNLSRYCNRDIDAVAKKAFDLEASDPGAAVALWSEVDRMLVNDGAFVTLGNPLKMEVISTRVGNYQARASYGAVLSQLWVR
jgi:ABC-type transport system substrate-binding protein/DNA-binding SARP family transcriptional activator/streptogramin lyase